MRICGKALVNTLKLTDNLSGSELEINYRMPTTSERQAYHNALVVKNGGTIERNEVEARVKYGFDIITGFRAGDFGRMNDEGQAVPMASDPAHEHYYASWRDELLAGAQDVALRVAMHIYELSVVPSSRAEAGKN